MGSVTAWIDETVEWCGGLEQLRVVCGVSGDGLWRRKASQRLSLPRLPSSGWNLPGWELSLAVLCVEAMAKMSSLNETGLKKQSSIEAEPQTLSSQQIEFAREIALYVISTKSFEEAMEIFTQGLEPVVAKHGMDDELVSIPDDEEQDYHFTDPLQRFRDIVTAPF
ncbi:hypothetical protein Droror1_Dr00001845 [Drosera rotundifolia]